MVTALILLQLAIVLALIFIGARVGSIGLGIYGMVGVFILVFGFGLAPGKLPIDVMLIIVSVITATASLQATGGLDYLVGVAARFLRKHPEQITFYGPLTTWLFCLVAGTAHTAYSLLPIISEVATNSKIRPERPMSVATIAASLGITGSPVSAATAAIISADLLGGRGIELKDILLNGEAIYNRTVENLHTTKSEFDVENLTKLPQVGIVYGYANCSTLPMLAFMDANFDGIVLAGVGDGNFYKDVFDVALKARAKGINIVRSSRVPTGPTCLNGEVDDAKYHFVAALTLNPQKARVLLMLALTKTRDWQKIQEYFQKY